MSNRCLIGLSGTWIILLAAFGCNTKITAQTPSKRKPNVILVMTDDQGYGDLGCHGNKHIKTPHLDRFYSESVRLKDFHVGPTCAPTRAALMTGRYCNRTGVWHTVGGRSLLRKNEVTMADIFKQSGYKTSIFGKWHLGDNYPYRPQDRGFDEAMVHAAGGVTQTPGHWGNDYFNDTYIYNGKNEKFNGYCTDVWFEGAKSFIKANKDVPFVVYIATNAPHGPFYVDPKYAEPYRNNPAIPNAEFYGMITHFDERFGQLRDLLKTLDIEDNTILIFMTDNGTAAGFSGKKGFNAGMRGTKGSEYDGGHRVPCFIRYPDGQIQGPADIEPVTSHIDILPTLMDLCGINDTKKAFDGKSLTPLLKDTDAGWPERTLITDSQRLEHPVKWRKSAVMTDRWRLVNGRELYDIKTDPGQKNDLANQSPQVVKKLRAEYKKWWQDISVDFDDYPPIIIGSDAEPESLITCHDWHGDDYPWNQFIIRKGMIANGFWAVEIEKDGVYEFSLRRWPKEADLPINASAAEMTSEIGEKYLPGKSFHITNARLKIANHDKTKSVTSQDKAIRFQVPLKAGPARLQTSFTSPDVELGAYYVYVRKIK